MTALTLDIKPEFLFLQYSKASGSPPKFGDFEIVYGAKIETITENVNSQPSELAFWFPASRWNDDVGILKGDKIQAVTEADVVIFEGFITKVKREFSGGNEQGGKYERLVYYALDYRWLLGVIERCYGQFSRSRDCFADNDDTLSTPLPGCLAFFDGRRCIFNFEGNPNKSPDDYEADDGKKYPIFGFDVNKDEYWLAADMIKFILSPHNTGVADYMEIDIDNITGLDHVDWQQYLGAVSIEGLSIPDALQTICKHIGWAYRCHINSDGKPELVFFKPGSGTQHNLFAPAPAASREVVGTSQLRQAVADNKKVITTGQFDEDITRTVNWLLNLGAKQRVEFTAELVPGWLDADLQPDVGNLFFTEADLAEEDTPNDYTFYKYYHSSGSQFKGDVGRIWVLNETGIYTDPDTYDRGPLFEWGTVIPPEMGFDKSGNRRYGMFPRRLLPCLTANKFTQDSVGIKVEFSFDGGATWYVLPAAINALDDQCGIIITEPNLAEIKPKGDLELVSTELDGEELNYWTSLCADKLDGNVWKDDEWNTRIRITASVQLDQRLSAIIEPLNSGSPFSQADVLDFSDAFFRNARDTSSVFSNSSLYAYERDDSGLFRAYLENLRNSMQDSSISGRFVFPKLWFDFKIGDSIAKIDGRNFPLRTRVGSDENAPEIVQIIHYIQKQQTHIITRDLRYSVKR